MVILNGQQFSPRDWTIFKSKVPGWQENYINKINNEYIALLSGHDAPSEKFWRLEKRIREDSMRSGVQLDMSRTHLVLNLVSLLNDGAIQVEELEDFSDESKTTVRFLSNRHSPESADDTSSM